MRRMEPFQEINYVIKYAVIPSSIIENTMYPPEHIIKEQNEREDYFIKLEESILKNGIRNPIAIAATKDKIFPSYGGSRLMIAQKYSMDIACIIADFDNIFPEAKTIREEEMESYFENPPRSYQLRKDKIYMHGCENIHLQEK